MFDNIYVVQINEGDSDVPQWNNIQAYEEYEGAEGCVEYYTDSEHVEADKIRIETLELVLNTGE